MNWAQQSQQIKNIQSGCKVLKHLASSVIPLRYTSTKQDLPETSNKNSTNFTDAGSGQYTALS